MRSNMKEAEFFKKVKETTDTETNDKFLKLIKDYESNKISTEDFTSSVIELFTPYPDLIENFKSFIPEEVRIEFENQIKGMNKRKEETNDSMPSENFQEDAKQFVQTIKEFYADKPKIYQDFLTLVKSFNSKKIKFATIAQRLSEIFQDHPEHIDSFAELMSNEKKQKLKKIAADLRNAKKSSNETERRRERMPPKRNSKRIFSNEYEFEENEIDFDKCDRYGPSYIILPKNIKNKVCSSRKELEKSVLNDEYVCIASGREGSFKDSLKNPHEDVLFRVEDDEHQLDTLIGRSQSLHRKLEELQKIIREKPPKMTPTEFISKNFLPFHETILKTIFKEKYTDIRAQIEWNTELAIGDIIETVRKQSDSWVKSRRMLGKIWKDVFVKSWLKSLDHQSITFHRKDEKEMAPKFLLGEIRSVLYKHIRDERVTDYHTVLSFNETYFNEQSKDEEELLLNILLRIIIKACFKNSCSDEEKNIIQTFLTERFESFINSTKKIIFFGTKDFYVVIKLLNIIFERIKLVKTLAKESEGRRWDYDGSLRPKRTSTTTIEISKLSTEKSNGDPIDPTEEKMDDLLNGVDPTDDKMEEEKTSEPQYIQRFTSFLSLVDELINENIDSNDYEDKILRAFGPKAYPLYTFNKLLNTTIEAIKQLIYSPYFEFMNQNFERYKDEILNDNDINKWFNRYESDSINIGAGSERAYKYVFHPYTKLVGVYIYTYPCDETPYSEINKWKGYVKQYLLEEPSLLDITERKIFLKRNINKVKSRENKGKLYQSNRLCGKIEKFTYKMLYCSGSEDYLVRRKV